MEAAYLNAPVGSRLQLLEDHLRELESSDSENESFSRQPISGDIGVVKDLEAGQSVLFEEEENKEPACQNHSSILFGVISDGDSDDDQNDIGEISSSPSKYATHSNSQESEVHRAIDDNSEDERLRREVREAAGMDDFDEHTETSRSRAASKKALESMDQSAARRRRALELEIPVKKVTEEQYNEMLSFLDDFEDAPATTKEPEVATFQPNFDFAPVMIYSSEDDDSDLEIIDHTPPTSPGSPRNPIKPLSGAVPRHLRGAAAIQEANARLLQLQRKQIQKLHQQQETQMKDRGLDIKAQTEREWNADLSDLLEQERLRAEKIALLERSSKASDSIVDFDDEESIELANARQKQLVALEDSESEAEADADSESEEDSEIPVKKSITRANLISDEDSDSDEDLDQAPKTSEESLAPTPTQATELTQQSTHALPNQTLTQVARPAKHESTQTAPRVDPKMLLALHQQQMARKNMQTQFDEFDELQEDESDLPNKEHSLLNVVLNDSPIDDDESDFTDVNQELERLRPASQPESEVDDLDMSGSVLEQHLNKRYNKAQERELQKQQMAEARRLIDAEAEESEDEDAPFGMPNTDDDGERSSDEDGDAEVQDLIDNTKVDVNGHAIGEQFRLEQLERDKKLMQQIADDVHGGWRRKRVDQRGVFGDDLDDHEIRAAEWERRKSQDRRAAMLENKELARMAEDERTRAFVEAATSSLIVKPRIAIAMTKHCSIKESLQFLDEPDDHISALNLPNPDETAPNESTLDAKLRAAQIRLSLRKTSSASARQSAYQERDSFKRRKLGIGQPSLASGPGALNGSTGLRPLSLAAQIPKKPGKAPRLMTPVVQKPARPALQTRNKLGDAIFKRQWV